MAGLENYLCLSNGRPSRNSKYSAYVQQTLPNILATCMLMCIIACKIITEGKCTDIEVDVVKIVQNDNNRCNDITSYRQKLENRY